MSLDRVLRNRHQHPPRERGDILRGLATLSPSTGGRDPGAIRRAGPSRGAVARHPGVKWSLHARECRPRTRYMGRQPHQVFSVVAGKTRMSPTSGVDRPGRAISPTIATCCVLRQVINAVPG